MAHFENGEYFFNPEIDGEDLEALEQVERLEHAANYKRMKNLQAQEANLSKILMTEALEEAGLTQEEYNKLFYEDPETSKTLLGQGMKHMTKSLAARKNKQPQPRQSQLEQAEPKEQQRKPNEVVQAAKEKVNKGSNLTQEEELDVIGSLVGRL